MGKFLIKLTVILITGLFFFTSIRPWFVLFCSVLSFDSCFISVKKVSTFIILNFTDIFLFLLSSLWVEGS